MNLELDASLEDYLEEISQNVYYKQAVKANNIVKLFIIRAYSIVHALYKLANTELHNYSHYTFKTLTEIKQTFVYDIAKLISMLFNHLLKY